MLACKKPHVSNLEFYWTIVVVIMLYLKHLLNDNHQNKMPDQNLELFA